MLNRCNCLFRRVSISAFAAAIVFGSAAQRQSPEWNIIKPSTTGVPGEEVRVLPWPRC